MGAVRSSLPSSWSMRTATAVTGLVMEAIQKRLSVCIGFRVARSAKPPASASRTEFFVTTTVTAPAASPVSTAAWMAAPTPGRAGEASENPAEKGEGETGDSWGWHEGHGKLCDLTKGIQASRSSRIFLYAPIPVWLRAEHDRKRSSGDDLLVVSQQRFSGRPLSAADWIETFAGELFFAAIVKVPPDPYFGSSFRTTWSKSGVKISNGGLPGQAWCRPLAARTYQAETWPSSSSPQRPLGLAP